MTNKDVFNLAVQFFGEDFVDMQGSTIYIHFPEVVVKNERDNEHLIRDVFIRFCVNNGKWYGHPEDHDDDFQMIRTTFTSAELKVGYMHSHAPGMGRVVNWTHTCLGRGPINGTIATLKTSPDELTWNMFFYELSKYVTIESLEGIPYIYMSRIYNSTRNQDDTRSLEHLLSSNVRVARSPSEYRATFDFLNYLKDSGWHKKLVFNNTNDYVSLAMSDQDLIIELSNQFIKWANSQKTHNLNVLLDDYLLKAKLNEQNQLVFIYTDTSSNYTETLDYPVVFKGITFPFKEIREERTVENDYLLILNPRIVFGIIRPFLSMINVTFSYDRFNIKKDRKYYI